MTDDIQDSDLRRVFDAAPSPVFLHDREFRLVLANRAYLDRAGLTEAEALGRPYWEVFPKNHGPMASCLHAIEKAEEEEEEEEIRLPGGEVFLSRSRAVLDEAGHYRCSRHDLTDITALDKTRQRLERLNRLFRAISLGNQALVRAEDEATLARDFCDVLVKEGGYRTAWIGLAMSDEGRSIHPLAAQGIGMDELRALGLTWADNECGQAPSGTCIRTRQPVLHRNLPEEIPAAYKEIVRDLEIQESLSLPLLVDGQVIGMLTVSAASHDLLGDEEIKTLTEMAGDLAYGIRQLRVRAERLGALEKLDESLDHAVTAIAATVEMRDPYTAGHQRRVADLACAIAREMGLPEDRTQGLRMAGTVHDIGKIHVPAEILSSPAKLTDAEFEIIKTHPKVGHEILKGIDFSWPVAKIVLQHHEKLDGSGYPQGIKGDDILLEARILTVADVVEAMASHRPYRPGFGIFPALQEISRHKGRLYDTAAVEACMRLFLEKSYSL